MSIIRKTEKKFIGIKIYKELEAICDKYRGMNGIQSFAP
jgi:hypothetical protein